MRTYNEFYDDKFLNTFGSYRDAIAQLPWNGEDPINIKKIIDLCEIPIEGKLGGNSGSWDSVEHIITVNILEPEYRQRFTLAHELGHALLDHEGEKLFRTNDLSKYQTVIDLLKEQSANQFAADVLMPKKLVIYFLKEILGVAKNGGDYTFGSVDTADIISKLADRLNVSPSAARYRLENLNILTTK